MSQLGDAGPGDEVTVPTTIRLLVADDQAMIRAGLRMIHDNEPDLAVVAEAANELEAVEAAAYESGLVRPGDDGRLDFT